MKETFYNKDKTKSFDIVIPDVSILGLWLSGGIDSSLLLYLLSKIIQDNKLDIKIQPATICLHDINLDERSNMSKKFDLSLAMIENYITARTITPNICNAVTKILNTNCIFPLKKYFPTTFVWKEYENIEKENLKNNIWEVLYSGRNANPPEEVYGGKDKWPNLTRTHQVNPSINQETFWKMRDREVVQDEVLDNGKLMIPFANIDKKFVADLYEQFNLLNILLPITKSCSFVPLSESVGCGKCFHCYEKYYGFGVY